MIQNQRLFKTASQQGRRRWQHRRRSFLTRPPQAAGAAYSRWATL